MEALLIIGILQATIALIFFFTKKRERADLFVILLLLVFVTHLSVELFSYIFSFSFLWSMAAKLPYLLLYGPLVYFYTLHEMSPVLTFKKSYILHVIPFLVVPIFFFGVQWGDIQGDEFVEADRIVRTSKLSLLDHNCFHLPPDETFLPVGSYPAPPDTFHLRPHDVIKTTATLVSLFVYILLILRVLRGRNERIRDYYSYESIYLNLQWLRYISIAFFVFFFFTSVLGFFIPLLIRHILLHPDMIYFLFTVLFMYVFTLFAVKQPVLANMDSSGKDENTERYRKSGLAENEADQYLLQIEEYMRRERPFLSSKLTISHISHSLNIPKHYITQVINSNLGKNFYTYVNEFRIEVAKELLLSGGEDRKILEIAFDSGFSSKSVFNTFFKKSTGLTPSQFRAKHQNFDKEETL